MVHEYHFVHGAGVIVLCLPEHLLAQCVRCRVDALGPHVLQNTKHQVFQHVLPSFDRHVVNLEIELQ